MNSSSSEITDEVIAIRAAEVALATPGVHSLHPGITETLQGNILRRAVDAPGVRVNRNRGRLTIDMAIVTEYEYNIPSVAWNVQERIKKSLENLQDDFTIEVVNIHVQKIYFSARQEEEDEQTDGQGIPHETDL